MPTCGYCRYWSESKVTSRGTINAIEISRKCPASLSHVQSDSKSCKYFNPLYFYCDKRGVRIEIIQCLNSRRNPKAFVANEPCKKCRQFEKDVREIAISYYIDSTPTITPRHLMAKDAEQDAPKPPQKKLKRRGKPGQEAQPKKLKRRAKPTTAEPPKKLRRRKTKSAPEPQPKKLKRRAVERRSK